MLSKPFFSRSGGVAGALLALLALLGGASCAPGDLDRVVEASAGDAQPIDAQPIDALPVALSAPRGWTTTESTGGAAALLRQGDCSRALDRLSREMVQRGEGPHPPASAHLLLGLYAHHCNRPELARAELLAASDPGGFFEDWRLLILAESYLTLDQPSAAGEVLATLLAEHPTSVLVPKAWSRAAESAWAAGDPASAWQWIDRGRDQPLNRAFQAELDSLAWQFSQLSGELERQRQAARRLLSRAPIEASKLEVVELFRSPQGQLDWPAILTPPELVLRGERLIEAGLAVSAQQTLEEVAAPYRSLRWKMLLAEAHLAQHAGAEALAQLTGIDSRALDPRLGARLEWLRGEAKADLAVVRRGSEGPSAARRAELKKEAFEHWRTVIELNSDPPLVLRAMRRTFLALDEAEQFDRSLEVLRALLRLDPEDETGLTLLWKRGWRQFERRNYTGAIGYWSELRSIYPHTRTARSAYYWTARAYEILGQRERAYTIYHRVVSSDVTDFYARHARARLPRSEASDVAAPAPLDWPRDSRLKRARLLTEAGLDELAMAEADAVGTAADGQALAALRAEILGRQGLRRPSVDAVIRAFPQLGWVNQTAAPEQALALYYPFDFSASVLAAARQQGLDPHLVLGMIRQESAFDRQAVSRSGARGLLQLMPATGREVAHRLGLRFSPARLADPEFNLRLGTTYFRQLLDRFDGDVELALAGYNGGPNRIHRLWRQAGHGERDRFIEGLQLVESRRYVKRILLLADSYRRLHPEIATRDS